MSQVTREKEMTVKPESLYRAITEFESYPKFLGEVVSAKILEGDSNRAKVQFELEIVKRFKYVLEFQMQTNQLVSWKLIESDFFKTNEGHWKLSANGTGTKVEYALDVSFGFLVPGWISKKLTETSLPKMFESFEGQAKTFER